MLSLLLLLTAAVHPPADAGGSAWRLPLGDLTAVVGRFDAGAGRFGPGHRGVDLAAAEGAAVHAAGAGTVSFASVLAGRGVLVIVHGELRTTYEPVEALVSPGERVEAGQVVGRLRSGHLRCLPAACLHWGLRRGEAYLDPLTLVGAGRVRLLPLGPQPAAPAPAGLPGRVASGSPPAAAAPTPDPDGQGSWPLPLGIVAAGAGAGWVWQRRWGGS